MVDPLTIAMSNSLLATKSQGTEAAVAMTAQGTQLANSMVKAGRVPDVQQANAAEKAQVATNQRLRPRVSKRNKNFPQPKQRSLGNEVSQTEDSDGITADAVWKTSGAQIFAPDQGSKGGQTADPWSIATSAQRLEEIDTDLVGRRFNRVA